MIDIFDKNGGRTPTVLLFLAMLWILFISSAAGQDLDNYGAIANTGLIRVKNQANNLPDSIGGTFEYKGASEAVAPIIYQSLLLSGSGTKTVTGGTVTAYTSVIVDSAVVLNVDSTSLLSLKGVLNEFGYVKGKVRRSDVLSGTDTVDSFGNLGVTISWQGTAPGITTVTRNSGTALIGNGNVSIKRSYDIEPTSNAGLNATLVFHYNPIELNGHNQQKLVLWMSTNEGANWLPEGGVVDTVAKTVTKSGISSFGLWTASDSLTPLGGYPKFLTLGSGNQQVAAVRSTITPLTVSVTSQQGFGIPGVEVDFAIVAVPSGAVGTKISTLKVLTNDLGQASTQLTLGSKIGQYIVSASSSGLSGSPVMFTTTGVAGAPKVLSVLSGNNQEKPIGSTLNAPFTAILSDSDANPVSGVVVSFSILQAPPGAAGMSLSAITPVTDTNGAASTTLTLGNRAGMYIVEAATRDITPVTFQAKALPKVAHILALNSGNGQIGIAHSFLPLPLSVTAVDSFGNPVQGVRVNFFVAAAPTQAVGESLTVASTLTDTNGQAQTFFRFGTKAGTYQVAAFSQGLVGSPVYFTESANIGSAAILALQAGNNQVQPILTPLDQPFEVIVTDSGGNPISGQPVQFAISSAPANQFGDSLSATSGITDDNGIASTVLTVGSRAGTYVVTATSGRLVGSPAQFSAQATILYGDDEGNGSVNISDLTTLIDAVKGTIHLTVANFIRADLDSNDVLNSHDENLLSNGLLHGKWDSVAFRNVTTLPGKTEFQPFGGFSATSGGGGTADTAQISARFELTPNGLRFNMTNNVPVRGIQVILRLNNPTFIAAPNVFDRGSMMQVPINDSAGLVHVIAYNNENNEIAPDSGTVFRLPVEFADTSAFTIVGVIVSTHDNKPYLVPVSKGFPYPGEYPSTFQLYQNYPNPFNITTNIEYTVPDVGGQPVEVLVQVFNIIGQKIKTLVKGNHEGGRYVTTWDATNNNGEVVATGVYFIRLWSPGQMLTMKMLLAK
jgi:hypothetical protein